MPFADPVMDAGQPCLEICEDEMDDGQKPYSQTNTTPGGCMRQPDKHASMYLPMVPQLCLYLRRSGSRHYATDGEATTAEVWPRSTFEKTVYPGRPAERVPQ